MKVGHVYEISGIYKHSRRQYVTAWNAVEVVNQPRINDFGPDRSIIIPNNTSQINHNETDRIKWLTTKARMDVTDLNSSLILGDDGNFNITVKKTVSADDTNCDYLGNHNTSTRSDWNPILYTQEVLDDGEEAASQAKSIQQSGNMCNILGNKIDVQAKKKPSLFFFDNNDMEDEFDELLELTLNDRTDCRRSINDGIHKFQNNNELRKPDQIRDCHISASNKTLKKRSNTAISENQINKVLPTFNEANLQKPKSITYKNLGVDKTSETTVNNFGEDRTNVDINKLLCNENFLAIADDVDIKNLFSMISNGKSNFKNQEGVVHFDTNKNTAIQNKNNVKYTMRNGSVECNDTNSQESHGLQHQYNQSNEVSKRVYLNKSAKNPAYQSLIVNYVERFEFNENLNKDHSNTTNIHDSHNSHSNSLTHSKHRTGQSTITDYFGKQNAPSNNFNMPSNIVQKDLSPKNHNINCSLSPRVTKNTAKRLHCQSIIPDYFSKNTNNNNLNCLKSRSVDNNPMQKKSESTNTYQNLMSRFKYTKIQKSTAKEKRDFLRKVCKKLQSSEGLDDTNLLGSTPKKLCKRILYDNNEQYPVEKTIQNVENNGTMAIYKTSTQKSCFSEEISEPKTNNTLNKNVILSKNLGVDLGEAYENINSHNTFVSFTQVGKYENDPNTNSCRIFIPAVDKLRNELQEMPYSFVQILVHKFGSHLTPVTEFSCLKFGLLLSLASINAVSRTNSNVVSKNTLTK